ncbi:hypothetical protein M433DRAFT_158251 [Acidomyces richmondensis BFW]|nr:MAG: hypothetical protein FE78DRAFT_85145 [Acidomyces sp. 'richmondensis']KYG42125.1 hypothetical protein M433DRAFT_158251 [Acidomyces richmondensis BFW]
MYEQSPCNYYSGIRKQPDRLHPAFRLRSNTLESPRTRTAEQIVKEAAGDYRHVRPRLYSGLSAQAIDYYGPTYLENPRSAPSPPAPKNNRMPASRTRCRQPPPLSYKAPICERHESNCHKPLHPYISKESPSVSAMRRSEDLSHWKAVSNGFPQVMDVSERSYPEVLEVSYEPVPSRSRHPCDSALLANEKAFRRRRSSIGDHVRIFTRSFLGLGHER